MPEGSGGLRTGGHKNAGLNGESSSGLISSFLISSFLAASFLVASGMVERSALADGTVLSWISSLISSLQSTFVEVAGDQSGDSCAMNAGLQMTEGDQE